MPTCYRTCTRNQLAIAVDTNSNAYTHTHTCSLALLNRRRVTSLTEASVWLRPYQPATLLQLYHVCSISVERMHKYSYHCAKNHFLKWLKITRGRSSSLEDLLCCSGSFFSCPVDCESPYSETVVAFKQISHIKTTCLSPSCHSSGLVRTFWVGLWCVVILRIRI